jgi:LysR family glycine cleavage system transcriptional activator
MADGLPSLAALRVFQAAARHEHFGRAGDELHVTHSAVSRQVRALEQQLGVSLFERRNRAVFLTDAGRRLFESTRVAFRQVAEAAAELRSGLPAPLVISCEPTLTLRWLIPRIATFQARHPDVVVHIRAAGGPISLAREDVDCAIRRSDFAWPPDVHAETIIEERVGPVCTPHLAAARDLQHLLSLPRLHSETRPDAWERWAADSDLTLPISSSQTFEHFYLSLAAASAGLGIAIGPEPLVIDALHEGHLVAPFGFKPNGFRYVMLSRAPIQRDPRKSKLLTWLREQAGL